MMGRPHLELQHFSLMSEVRRESGVGPRVGVIRPHWSDVQNTRAQNIDLLIEKKNGPSEAALFLLGDFTQNKKGRSGRLIFFLGEIVGPKFGPQSTRGHGCFVHRRQLHLASMVPENAGKHEILLQKVAVPLVCCTISGTTPIIEM